MMTVITRVSLKAGSESEWDKAMQDRLDAARQQTGWVGGQMLTPVDGQSQRVIVGTWKTKENWKSWHEDPAFQETRQRMDELQDAPDRMEWFEVAIDPREGV